MAQKREKLFFFSQQVSPSISGSVGVLCTCRGCEGAPQAFLPLEMVRREFAGASYWSVAGLTGRNVPIEAKFRRGSC